MKNIKTGLRIWIAAASTIGFLGGWAMLAHSGKPVNPTTQSQQPVVVQQAPIPTLPPIPSLGDPNSGLQPLPSIPQTSFSFPSFRTGGS
jgi:hypothetical protein